MGECRKVRSAYQEAGRSRCVAGGVNGARPERAEIVIRRGYVGHGSNDIGFARQLDGTFRAIISEYDQRTPGTCGPYDQGFLGRLTQAYSLRTIQHHYRARGYQVQVQRQSDGTIQVVAER